MGQPFVGEIRMFGGNFAPAGWAFCDGSLLAISENDTLFTLIGTTYGGDGQETFCLPNLMGRMPIHAGQGPGITRNYVLGEMAGAETVTLTSQQMPNHTHPLVCQAAPGILASPEGNLIAGSALRQFAPADPTNPMLATAIGPAGGSQPHENMMPYQVVSFIISLYGVFPHT